MAVPSFPIARALGVPWNSAGAIGVGDPHVAVAGSSVDTRIEVEPSAASSAQAAIAVPSARAARIDWMVLAEPSGTGVVQEPA